MKRILGLDLGTASIGWAVVNQSEKDDEQSSIVKIGVRVNPLTTDEKNNFETGKSITTNADRTLKRSMRRNLQRYKLRRNALIDILLKNGIITDSTILSEEGNNSTFRTYRQRALAATEEVSLEDFGRTLLMINKKRGYKSSRKAKGQDEGQLIDGMEIAKALYNEEITPGQYTLRLLEEGKNYEPDFYRSDLIDELDKIWSFQRSFYPDKLTDQFRQEIADKSNKATSQRFYSRYNIHTAEEKDKKIRLKTYYRWRVEALSQQLEIEKLATVICNINGAISKSSGYLGSISDHSKELYFNHLTVGQYLYSNIQKNPHYRVKNQVFYRQDYLDEFNTIWDTQAKYHPELTPELKKDIRDVVIFYQRRLKSQKGLISLCEFEQHKIRVKDGDKVREKVVGLKVCPKSSPLFQEFRIWQNINNLTITGKGEITEPDTNGGSLFPEMTKNIGIVTRQLRADERELLHNELSISEKLTSSEILSLLGLGKKGSNEYKLNFKEIKGNTTFAKIFKCLCTIYEMTGHDVGSLTKQKSADEKIATLSKVFEGLGFNTDFLAQPDYTDTASMQRSSLYHIWHLLYSYVDDNSATGDEKLVEHIAEITGLDNEYARILANATFEQDYGSLSSKAMLKILPFLKEGQIYSDACQSAGYRHSAASLTKEEIQSRSLIGSLAQLHKGELRNPVVEKILNQMINVVNELNSQYGKIDPESGNHYFDEVHIELARELKKSAEEREAADKAIRENTAKYEIWRKEISALTGSEHVSRTDLIRYRLYLELKDNGFKTLYSDTYIAKEKIFSGDFDIEHIIPQAKLFDDSFANKTLELRDINREKSNLTAYDFIAKKYGDAEAEKYLDKVKNLFDKPGSRTKYKNLIAKEKDIPSDFINRDLRDSQYIAKKAKEILYGITRTVVSTTGAITDRLREDWQLIDAMKELNWNKYYQLGLTEEFVNHSGQTVRRIIDWTKRNDHRHHAMDALTIAFTKPSHIQYLNNLNARSDRAGAIYAIELKELHRDEKDNHLRFNPPFDGIRKEAMKHLSNILVSIKAKNKVATLNTNITKRSGGSNKTVQLTPRGQLHNETVYGRRLVANVKLEKVGSKCDAKMIATICSPAYRAALLDRLNAFGGDPKKAFTGANSLAKKPIYLNEEHTEKVPDQVKTKTFETIYTIRKPISADLKIDKVMDEGVKRILQERLKEYGGDARKAFDNLDDNPIWLNKEKGISIRTVAIKGVNVAQSLHEKRDKDGNFILNDNGERIPTDFVSTSNNHHVAIFVDPEGNYQEHIVPLYEATANRSLDYPVVDKNYNSDKGWKFLFTLKQNEYFVFPEYERDENGKPTDVMSFNPNEIDLLNPDNYAEISKHLYRVQKFSTKYYVFRHHLETQIIDDNRLKDTIWLRITALNNLKNVVKVRVNNVGQIVDVGEY